MRDKNKYGVYWRLDGANIRPIAECDTFLQACEIVRDAFSGVMPEWYGQRVHMCEVYGPHGSSHTLLGKSEAVEMIDFIRAKGKAAA